MKKEWVLSEEEKTEARELGQKLCDMIEYHFPRPFNEEAMEEIKRVRARLEEMGFRVDWSITVNPVTLATSANVSLYIPASATIH